MHIDYIIQSIYFHVINCGVNIRFDKNIRIGIKRLRRAAGRKHTTLCNIIMFFNYINLYVVIHGV